MNVFKVVLSSSVKKALLKIPIHVVQKLQAWIDNIEINGLNEVRKVPGYHDEPLKGTRVGQRSIRLSKAYRAIYTKDRDGNIAIIKVLEVHKHAY